MAAAQAAEPGLLFDRIGDLPLEGGGVIHDFSIGYMTAGTLNADKSNAVLMVTAIGGNHHRIDFMIGPGLGLDTDRLFVIKTDAIGNGITTSPSTSVTQHGPDFPAFSIRDMVESQYRLLQHLGITHLVAVAGASMGGMQTLQWGVSHPDMMDNLVALTPMAQTSPWSIAVNHATRRALMLDPAFAGGHYTTQPEQGWRLRADVLQVLATRTPAAMRLQFAQPADVLPWIAAQEDAVVKSGFDANDWIAQTRAYDAHNVGDTLPAFHGDPVHALHSVKGAGAADVGPARPVQPGRGRRGRRQGDPARAACEHPVGAGACRGQRRVPGGGFGVHQRDGADLPGGGTLTVRRLCPGGCV